MVFSNAESANMKNKCAIVGYKSTKDFKELGCTFYCIAERDKDKELKVRVNVAKIHKEYYKGKLTVKKANALLWIYTGFGVTFYVPMV